MTVRKNTRCMHKRQHSLAMSCSRSGLLLSRTRVPNKHASTTRSCAPRADTCLHSRDTQRDVTARAENQYVQSTRVHPRWRRVYGAMYVSNTEE